MYRGSLRAADAAAARWSSGHLVRLPPVVPGVAGVRAQTPRAMCGSGCHRQRRDALVSGLSRRSSRCRYGRVAVTDLFRFVSRRPAGWSARAARGHGTYMVSWLTVVTDGRFWLSVSDSGHATNCRRRFAPHKHQHRNLQGETRCTLIALRQVGEVDTSSRVFTSERTRHH